MLTIGVRGEGGIAFSNTVNLFRDGDEFKIRTGHCGDRTWLTAKLHIGSNQKSTLGYLRRSPGKCSRRYMSGMTRYVYIRIEPEEGRREYLEVLFCRRLAHRDSISPSQISLDD